MEECKRIAGDQGGLRHRAEERVVTTSPEIRGQMSEDEVRALVHELQVHQVELEMQNEELERARQEAEDLKEQYLDLYEFAPVAYFTFDAAGTILSVNLTGAGLLNVPRSALIGRRFQLFLDPASRASFSECARAIIESGERRTFEVQAERESGPPAYLQIEGAAVESAVRNTRQCRAAIMDITERKRVEAREKELEQQKLEFYRRTILAATSGRLMITDPGEIERIAGPCIASWAVSSPDDLTAIRRGLSVQALSAGMDESRADDFVFATGEAVTNAFRHAGGGTASLYRMPDSLMLVVSDTGPGIAALSLPDLALTEGYSTAGTLGMGYKVMVRVADRVRLATGPEGTTVGVEMNLRASTAQPLWNDILTAPFGDVGEHHPQSRRG